MNGYRLAALASLAAGAALLAYGISVGQAEVGLLLFIPFIMGSGLLPLAAMLLVFAAFVLWSIGSVRMMQERAAADAYAHEPWRGSPPTQPTPPTQPSDAHEAQRADETRGTRRTTKSGGVVLLGPIPIVWGSDRRILPWMVAAGLTLLTLALLLTFLSAR